jgi:hypothetical protein
MWEPRRLTILWDSTVSYRDSFTLFFCIVKTSFARIVIHSKDYTVTCSCLIRCSLHPFLCLATFLLPYILQVVACSGTWILPSLWSGSFHLFPFLIFFWFSEKTRSSVFIARFLIPYILLKTCTNVSLNNNCLDKRTTRVVSQKIEAAHNHLCDKPESWVSKFVLISFGDLLRHISCLCHIRAS